MVVKATYVEKQRELQEVAENRIKCWHDVDSHVFKARGRAYDAMALSRTSNAEYNIWIKVWNQLCEVQATLQMLDEQNTEGSD